MPDGNPLVAAPKETTTAVTGIGIAESCVDIAHGVSNGDSWTDRGFRRDTARDGLEDGALIEIYVFDTAPDDWRRVIEWLAAEGRVESLTRSGEPVSLVSTSDLFTTDDAEFAMSVRIGRQLWTTSFYSPAEIDLQGDPRETQSHEDLEQIAAFMGDLNRLTGKRVVLVTETLAPRETTPYLSVG